MYDEKKQRGTVSTASDSARSWDPATWVANALVGKSALALLKRIKFTGWGK